MKKLVNFNRVRKFVKRGFRLAPPTVLDEDLGRAGRAMDEESRRERILQGHRVCFRKGKRDRRVDEKPWLKSAETTVGSELFRVLKYGGFPSNSTSLMDGLGRNVGLLERNFPFFSFLRLRLF